jgi:geranylgeranyl diphosphate synthase type II
MSGKLGDIAALTDPDCGAAQSGGELAALLEALNSLPALAREGRETSAGVLLESMRYSLGLRGKRARGLLVLLVAQGWSEPWQNALDCAHAVEMVHTASLIVDDLPSMDNAATRRGQPTNHVQFGQPVAILSSIALLSEALRLLSTSDQLAQDQRNLAVSCLASAIGPDGMAAGQIRDLTPPGDTQTDVEVTHALKTGTLFAAAAELGCIAAGVDGPRKWLLSDFGMLLGKAFQEFDDLIDVATASRKAGKDTGKDVGKPTIVGLLGREKAEEHALRQVGLALECLEAAGIEARELRQYTLDLTRAMRAMIGPAQSIKGGMA